MGHCQPPQHLGAGGRAGSKEDNRPAQQPGHPSHPQTPTPGHPSPTDTRTPGHGHQDTYTQTPGHQDTYTRTPGYLYQDTRTPTPRPPSPWQKPGHQSHSDAQVKAQRPAAACEWGSVPGSGHGTGTRDVSTCHPAYPGGCTGGDWAQELDDLDPSPAHRRSPASWDGICTTTPWRCQISVPFPALQCGRSPPVPDM